MSEIIKDELIKPMDRAIWNVEHVIKFSKSKHFRYYGHDIPLIDYYGTIVILSLSLILIIKCYCLIINIFRFKYFSIKYIRDRIKFFVKSKYSNNYDILDKNR